MKKQDKKDSSGNRINIYVKTLDRELFKWAKKQRQSLSEVIALALQEYREKHSK
jgi:molybdenum cofactor biosynthesis enzyme MoaA